MNLTYKEISLPKFLTSKYMLDTLKSSEIIFKSINEKRENYILNLSKIEKVSVLGVLVIYKIIEFSVEKNCFLRPKVRTNAFIKSVWEKYEFLPLMEAYVYGLDTASTIEKMTVKLTDKFILAPQPLLRNSDFTEKYLEQHFLPKIKSYYSSNEKAITMIFNCFSEILLNFWEHAVDDTKSIMIADGNKDHIEIACADTGSGIITSLGKSMSSLNLSNVELIKKSVEKDVTSKKMTNHMGFGLWLINEITSAVKGKFHLYSEGTFYRNENGKISSGSCPYWKGTIVYLALPLSNSKTYDDIQSLKSERLNSIKINFYDC